MDQKIEHCMHAQNHSRDNASITVTKAPPPIDHTFVFRHAPVGMILSRNRVIHACNDAAAHIFGYERDALIEKTFCLLYPSAEEFARFGVAIASILQADGRYSDERIMKHASGELFWCRVTGSALQRGDPHAEAIWVFEDLSNKRMVGVNLTPREREISSMLIDGKTCKLIARRIGLSPRTVEMHKSKLMRKYSVTNSAELVQRLQS